MRSANAWPGLAVLDGPPLPGDDDGRVFAVERSGVTLTPAGTVPFAQGFPGFTPTRPTLWTHGEEALWVQDERWHRQGRAGPVDVHDDGEVLQVGPWKIELRGDVGATVQLKRWKSRVLARPLGRVGSWAALWLLATEPQWWITLDRVGFMRRLRRVGVSFAALGQRVDPAIARFIARGLDNREGEEGVTFDGVVDGEIAFFHRGPNANAGSRFAALTAELPHAPLDGPFAPIDVVADFVRSLDPIGWEREQLLREECAIAVSMLKPERA